MPRNFQVVIPNKLYRSGSISPSELKSLAGHLWNVTRIVSLDLNNATAIKNYIPDTIEHIVMPIDLGGNPSLQARKLGTQIRDGLFQVKEGAVLVHCAAGQDRTGLAIALFRAIKQGRSCDAIFAEADSKGYGQGLNESTKKAFDLEICRYCFGDYCKKFKVENDEVTTGPDAQPADDIANKMRDEVAHQQGSFSAGTTAPIFDQQQSFSIPADPTPDIYSTASRKLRKLRLKKILKSIQKNKDENNIVDVGSISNYNGIPSTNLNGASASPGSPNAAGPVDSGTAIQL